LALGFLKNPLTSVSGNSPLGLGWISLTTMPREEDPPNCELVGGAVIVAIAWELTPKEVEEFPN